MYANFGTEEDFGKLKKMDIDVEDKIVLIRYGVITRNKKVFRCRKYLKSVHV